MPAFQPSKLGTKEHWNDVYDEEIKNFEEMGEEGEIWFGEESMENMVEWALSNIAPPSRKVLEIGAGNGLLLCELAKHGYHPSLLLGIDYSPGSVRLSRQVANNRGFDQITFTLCDFLREDPPCISDMQEVVNSWDLLLDKGTFDAITLAEKDGTGQSPSDLYPARVSRLLRHGGFFLITSCNFTEEELKERFLTIETGLVYQYEAVTYDRRVT